MTDDEQQPKHRRVKVDYSQLEWAFHDASGVTAHYLDVETGEVVSVSEETKGELEALLSELSDEEADESAIEAALAERGMPDWQIEAVLEGNRVEEGYGERYIRVPEADSSEGYRDMEGFIDTVSDARLRSRLAGAIRGRGAFVRFKDELARYPEERERWFQFSSERTRQRILEWLEDEGVELVD